MVYITKNLPNCPYISGANSYFAFNISIDDLTEKDLNVMRVVDGAEVLDFGSGCIKTKFGIAHLSDLSSGCKTVLIYNYLVRNGIKSYLDVTECGWNALECLFSNVEMNNKDNIFILRHTLDLYYCGERDYNVDGKVGRSLCRLIH